MKASLGLIVNPIAGMGGAVGLHGTDGTPRFEEAKRRGAKSVTASRTAQTLRRLDGSKIGLTTVRGPMGADIVESCNIEYEVIPVEFGDTTTGADTEVAARALVEAGCELILFAGGDGTALDVVRGADSTVPILGIPSGVKMRSGVFAVNPEAAGDIANDFFAGHQRSVRPADLVDISDDGSTERLFGVAVVPSFGGGRLASSKSSTTMGSIVEIVALCRALASELEPDTLYLFGPGSTTTQVLNELGLTGSPLGVDAVINGTLVGTDLSEEEILELLRHGPRSKLVLGVVGGQGFLLGRGNQQLSSQVLEYFDSEDLVIISSASKLVTLNPAVLWVDLNGGSPSWVTGYHQVRVAPRKSVLMRVATSVQDSNNGRR